MFHCRNTGRTTERTKDKRKKNERENLSPILAIRRYLTKSPKATPPSEREKGRARRFVPTEKIAVTSQLEVSCVSTCNNTKEQKKRKHKPTKVHELVCVYYSSVYLYITTGGLLHRSTNPLVLVFPLSTSRRGLD